MKLLVDTQSLIWFLTAAPQLSEAAKDALEDEANVTSVSAASFWEMGIKLAIRKLTLPVPFREFIDRALISFGMGLEPIMPGHAEAVAVLPLHHRDPFDRIIVVQAQLGGYSIVSSDDTFDAYGVARVW